MKFTPQESYTTLKHAAIGIKEQLQADALRLYNVDYPVKIFRRRIDVCSHVWAPCTTGIGSLYKAWGNLVRAEAQTEFNSKARAKWHGAAEDLHKVALLFHETREIDAAEELYRLWFSVESRAEKLRTAIEARVDWTQTMIDELALYEEMLRILGEIEVRLQRRDEMLDFYTSHFIYEKGPLTGPLYHVLVMYRIHGERFIVDPLDHFESEIEALQEKKDTEGMSNEDRAVLQLLIEMFQAIDADTQNGNEALLAFNEWFLNMVNILNRVRAKNIAGHADAYDKSTDAWTDYALRLMFKHEVGISVF